MSGLPQTEARFLEELERLGIADWTPGGRFDSDVGVWVTEAEIVSSFPESGVDVFSAVDQHSFWFDHRNEVIADLLEREVPEGLPFVEVGAGSGVVVDYLRRFTNRPVASIEPIPAAAAAVAKRGVPLSFCGDLASLDLPSRCLPALGAFDVVEHLDDPSPLLMECHRVIRHDGRLILTVPAYQWLWSDFDVWNGHFRRYTVSSLSRELNDAGFELSSATYVFLPLLLPAAISRLVLGKLRKPKSAITMEAGLEESLAPSSPFVHRSLRRIHGVERAVLRRSRIPFGTSVLVSARPKL